MGDRFIRMEFVSSCGRPGAEGECPSATFITDIVYAAAAEPTLRLVGAIWLLATLALFLGYRLGRDAWREKFGVGVRWAGTSLRVSGVWFEWALISYVAILVLLVEVLTPASSMPQLVLTTWPFVPVVFAATLVLVAIYEIRTARAVTVIGAATRASTC